MIWKERTSLWALMCNFSGKGPVGRPNTELYKIRYLGSGVKIIIIRTIRNSTPARKCGNSNDANASWSDIASSPLTALGSEEGATDMIK